MIDTIQEIDPRFYGDKIKAGAYRVGSLAETIAVEGALVDALGSPGDSLSPLAVGGRPTRPLTVRLRAEED